MDIKGMLKSIDWKGIALRHCEKAGIAVVTCLLLLFLVKGFRNAVNAGGVKAEEIQALAEDLEKRLKSSTWDDGVASREGVINPDLQRQLDALKSPIDAGQLVFRDKFFFWLPDFGRILRSKPEVLAPYELLATADRGAISLYQMDEKGKFKEKQVKLAAADLEKKKKDRDEEEEDKGKKKGDKKAPKTGKGGMLEKMKGQGGDGGDMAKRYRGMMGGMAGGMGPMGGGMGPMGGGMGGAGGLDAGAGGAGLVAGGSGLGEDAGGDAAGGSLLAASQRRRSESTGRKQSSGSKRFANALEAEQKKMKPGEKLPTAIPIKEEEIRGVRWVVVTALFSYLEQVEKYADALNTRKQGHPDEYPEFHHLKVERRYLAKGGSFSDWEPIDTKRLDRITRRIPATEDLRRREAEDPEINAANAIFRPLVMPLPELAAGEWVSCDRPEAREAVRKSGAVAFFRGGDGEGGDMGEDAGGDDGARFGPGGGAGPGGGGMIPMTAGGPVGAGGGGGGVMGGPPGGMTPGGGMNPMSAGGPVGASGGGGGVMGGPPGGFTAGGGPMGGAPGGMMNQQMGNLRGGPFGNRGGDAAAGGAAVKKGGSIPQKKVQKTNVELVQVRFIDYTAEPEHTFQYRFKVVVHNPNYRHAQAAEREFKKIEFLDSDEWSEPSPPVFVPPDTEYFVLERNKQREEARLQVHDWRVDLGDWNFRDFLAVKPGDPIGAKVKEYQIVNWDNTLEKRDYDFFTQDLLIDVSGGARSFYFVGEDGKEASYSETLPAEILVLDRLGDLATRSEDFDKHDLTRKERETYLADLKSKAQKEDKKAAGGKTETGSGEDFDEDLPSRGKGGTSKDRD